MSCIYCQHYAGVQMYCLQAHYVATLSESIDCDDFMIKAEMEE